MWNWSDLSAAKDLNGFSLDILLKWLLAVLRPATWFDFNSFWLLGRQRLWYTTLQLSCQWSANEPQIFDSQLSTWVRVWLQIKLNFTKLFVICATDGTVKSWLEARLPYIFIFIEIQFNFHKLFAWLVLWLPQNYLAPQPQSTHTEVEVCEWECAQGLPSLHYLYSIRVTIKWLLCYPCQRDTRANYAQTTMHESCYWISFMTAHTIVIELLAPKRRWHFSFNKESTLISITSICMA